MLTIRWSSGSFGNSVLDLPSSLANSSIGTKSASNQGKFPEEQKPWENSQYLCPMDLPVAFVNVHTTTSRPQIGFGTECVLAKPHVSADVSFVPLPDPSSLAPLDIIILLDSLSVEPSLIAFSLY